MRKQNAFIRCSLSMVSSTVLIPTPTPPLAKTILACSFLISSGPHKVVNSNNDNRKTARRKKKEEKHAENLEMSKTPTKIVQKKKRLWNTEIRLEKKKMFKTLSSDTKKHKVSRNKSMFGSIYKKKKKTEPKFGSYFLSYKYRLLRGFLLEKKKEKEKKKYKAKNHTSTMSSRNN